MAVGCLLRTGWPPLPPQSVTALCTVPSALLLGIRVVSNVLRCRRFFCHHRLHKNSTWYINKSRNRLSFTNSNNALLPVRPSEMYYRFSFVLVRKLFCLNCISMFIHRINYMVLLCWFLSAATTFILLQHKKRKIINELENVAIIATYCHLRPPDVIAFPT